MNRIRLKRLFDSVSGGSWGVEPDEGEVTLPCVRGTDFDYRVLRVNIRTAPVRGFASHEVAKRAARRGDLIIEKSGGGEQQPVGRAVLHDSDDMVMPTNFAARLSPSSDNDPQFLTYLLSALYAVGTTRSSIKQTTGIQNLDLHSLLDTKVFHPSLQDQRAIADFLDAETARIDALIAKKRKLAALVEARFSRAVEVEVEHLVEKHGSIPLKRFTGVTVGIVVQPSRWYVDEGGVAALRGVNVRPGRLDLNDLVRISEEGHLANAKSRLHTGDLVVVRTGDAGAAVVVPSSLNGANCIDLLLIRRSPELDSQFLEFVLNSAWTKKQITRGSVGTIQSHFNVESLRELPTPDAPLDVQRNLRQRLSTESVRVSKILSKLRHQIKLLAEHRQALVTAAVTGEIEVPEAAAS